MEPEPGSSFAVVSDLLGLSPACSGDAPDARLGVVAARKGPRFLVPLASQESTMASCLGYQGLRDPRTRFGRRAVATALRTGVSRLVLKGQVTADTSDDSLLGHLRHVLGNDDLSVAVGLGRMDELWRPTLQVFDHSGEPIAFVKVGRGPVVSELVATEAAALRLWEVADDPRLVVPEVLAESRWRDVPILCVAPMPTDARRLPRGSIGAWPVRTLDPPLAETPLAHAAWWTSRRSRHADDADIDPILDRIEARHQRVVAAWGRWHGDWVPWNLARSQRGLVAWDWEYSEPGAPVGLDETHFAYQVAHLQQRRPVADALQIARRAAPSAWVADAHVAMLVTRAGDLARLAGRPVTNHHEVLSASAAVVR